MKIKIDSTKYQFRKTSTLPSKIELNREVSWMIGMWVGDNYSSKKGTVKRENGRSSGRFGIINNNRSVIKRFMNGLREHFGVNKIKIDVHLPRSFPLEKEKWKNRVAEEFGVNKRNINVYFGSPWRRNVGFAVYTNNTALLRAVYHEIYEKLPSLINEGKINIQSFLQGIADAEGDVDKANRNVGITTKEKFVIEVISLALTKLQIRFTLRKDIKSRFIIEIKDLDEFKKKVNFSVERKRQELKELLEGNLMRRKDKEYLAKFKEALKKGATSKELAEKFKIPYPTVKLVLRNLISAEVILRKKYGRKFIYYLPTSAELSGKPPGKIGGHSLG